jgi:hypothetical protein
MSPSAERDRAIGRARIVAALVGLSVALTGLPGWFAAPSVAAPATSNGSDWGPTGLARSSSQVTVHWDNTDTPSQDVVYRDGRQTIPHTNNKTYDDIPGSVVSAYFDAYGPNNGYGGLRMTVSQTQDLVNQTVTLDIAGVKGGEPYGIPSTVGLQVFQCWGGLKANGAPDLNASEPDPATCQVGTGDAAARAGGASIANSRFINTDPLITGGDWDKYFNRGGANDVPFTAINGQLSGSTVAAQNQFFNAATTNEISRIQVSAAGTATRQFEVQTAIEAPGMGCGLRRGILTTRNCWLVVIPRVNGQLDQNGPIAPSLWAQRLQVKLGFRDIVAGCPGGQERTLTVGSVLLSTAAASWTPGLCDAKNLALGYTQVGDPVARTEFDSGATDGLLTTLPADRSAIYTPVTLAAPVITYALSYQPKCPPIEGGYTEDEAINKCGYPSLAALNTDTARAGALVRDLKLDARLVAKLLTQSYVNAIFDMNGFRRFGWMVSRPASLAEDPEFQRLNPDLNHISLTSSSIDNLSRMVLESLRSDSAAQVWSWILQDPDAKAFLDGCPDPSGMTINPFYSSRTYAECTGKALALGAQEDADRKATPTPASYVDLPLTYPPDGSPYPLPDWQEASTPDNPVYSVYDFLPRVDSMPIAGRDVAIGYLPRNDTLCLSVLDSSCQPAPGKWTDSRTRQAGDSLGGMAITTSATAARFQLPTALLCDTSGAHCVGASASSLQKAAARFVKDPTTGLLVPGPVDYSSGAYPLAMPVYLGVPKSAPLSERASYAHALNYITTTGQVPGYGPGNLPPGYAPLTAAMRAEAKASIAALFKAAPAGGGKTSGSTGGTTGSTGSTGDSSTPPATTSGGSQTPTGGSHPSQVTVGSPQYMAMAATPGSWPSWPMPLGLAIIVLAGLAGPIMRLRGAVRLG